MEYKEVERMTLKDACEKIAKIVMWIGVALSLIGFVIEAIRDGWECLTFIIITPLCALAGWLVGWPIGLIVYIFYLMLPAKFRKKKVLEYDTSVHFSSGRMSDEMATELALRVMNRKDFDD